MQKNNTAPYKSTKVILRTTSDILDSLLLHNCNSDYIRDLKRTIRMSLENY